MKFQNKPMLIILAFIFTLLSVADTYAQDKIYKKCKRKYCYFEDIMGNKINDQKYNDAKRFTNGRAGVKINNKWGFIDSKGELVIDYQYDEVEEFSKFGVAIVTEKTNAYLIDYDGKKLIEDCDSIHLNLFNGTYITMKNNLKGIVDKYGEVVESPKFEAFGASYDDVLTVKYQGKWGNWENGKFIDDGSNIYFNIPDEFPVFGEKCVSIKDADDQKSCSDRAMLETIYKNIKYPTEARKKGIEGMIVIQFVVTSEGSIKNTRILKGIGGGCDEEGLRVVNNYLNSWAKPAMHDGQKVNMIFNLPLRYRLE